MLDSLFSRAFRASKCKTLLKLATSRIKLLRNKRDVQIKQMRRELAQLLQNGQESAARIRVEHIIREQNIIAAYDILELYCDLIVVRLPIIESQRECPIDLREAISSLVFAAPRCADLPELLEVRGLFAIKYGKEFVAAAAELRPDCGVSRQIIEKLSVRAPTAELKLKLMKEIAKDNDVDWDSSGAETELFKSPEDLLDGPSQFLGNTEISTSNSAGGGSKLSTFKYFEKDVEAGEAESQSNRNMPFHKEIDQLHSLKEAEPGPPFVSGKNASLQIQREDSGKQFIPFVMPSKGYEDDVKSPEPTNSFNKAGSEAGFDNMPLLKRSHSRSKSEGSGKYQNVVEAALAAAESAEKAARAARAAANLAKLRMFAEPSNTFESTAEAISSDSDNDSSAIGRSSSFNERKGGFQHAPSKSDVQGTVEETARGHTAKESRQLGEHDTAPELSDTVNPFSAGSVLPPPGHPNRPMTTRGRGYGEPRYGMPHFDEPARDAASPQLHRLPSDDLDLRYPDLFVERSMPDQDPQSNELHRVQMDAAGFPPSAPPIKPIEDDLDSLDARFRSLKFRP